MSSHTRARGWGSAESNGAGAGQPGGAFIFAAGARRDFFCCGFAASSLTHLLPAASEHPRQKDIQGPGRFFCCGCASSLTHSLPAARTHSKKAPTANNNKKKKRVPRRRASHRSLTVAYIIRPELWRSVYCNQNTEP